MGAGISQSKDDAGEHLAMPSCNGLRHEPEWKPQKVSWNVSVCAGGTMCGNLDELIFEELEDDFAPVTLHVYDVGSSRPIRAVNQFLRKLGTGIFHCGLEVFGGEWSYANTGGECGVFCCIPGQCKGFRHVESIDLGKTNLSVTQFRLIIAQLQSEWVSEEYHLLAQNCCDFCCQMAQKLGVASPPQWINSLAGSLARLIAETPEHEKENPKQACLCCTRTNVLNTTVVPFPYADEYESTSVPIDVI
jgi:hypothetical protein